MEKSESLKKRRKAQKEAIEKRKRKRTTKDLGSTSNDKPSTVEPKENDTNRRTKRQKLAHEKEKENKDDLGAAKESEKVGTKSTKATNPKKDGKKPKVDEERPPANAKSRLAESVDQVKGVRKTQKSTDGGEKTLSKRKPVIVKEKKRKRKLDNADE